MRILSALVVTVAMVLSASDASAGIFRHRGCCCPTPTCPQQGGPDGGPGPTKLELQAQITQLQGAVLNLQQRIQVLEQRPSR